MFEQVKDIEIGQETKVDCAAILVVRLEARPTARSVYVTVHLNGLVVANGSAADNTTPGVISTNLDTVTVPVKNGSVLKIDKTGPGIAEAKLYRF